MEFSIKKKRNGVTFSNSFICPNMPAKKYESDRHLLSKVFSQPLDWLCVGEWVCMVGEWPIGCRTYRISKIDIIPNCNTELRRSRPSLALQRLTLKRAAERNLFGAPLKIDARKEPLLGCYV